MIQPEKDNWERSMALHRDLLHLVVLSVLPWAEFVGHGPSSYTETILPTTCLFSS